MSIENTIESSGPALAFNRISLLKGVIASVSELFAMPEADLHDIQTQLIRESF